MTERTKPSASELSEMLDRVDHVIDHELEQDDNLDRVEALLEGQLAWTWSGPEEARIYAYLAQVHYYRYEYEPEGSKARREHAREGTALAKKALGLDEHSMWANAWAAALLGVHGLEEGILSIVQYLPRIEALARRAVEMDEAYSHAMGHQTLGGLYRLAPPWPISVGDKKRSLEHLERVRALAPDCPVGAISYAETQLARRKKAEAAQALRFVLDTRTILHGPRFMERQKLKARKLMEKIQP